MWATIPKYSNNLFYDANTRILSFNNLYLTNYIAIYLFNFNKILSSFSVKHFIKLKFKGKGYYIYKNKRNTITPQFGYSHRHYLYGYFTSVKFRSKTSIMIYSLSYSNIIFYSFLLKALRPINIFTGRGVRFNKEIIFKKVGKVSSYR
jgi:ribosomal protein L6P/L9E